VTKFSRTNPVTGQLASEAEAMKAGDMAAIARKAHEGFVAWSQLGPMRAAPC
jgi:benzaldehyde dehydrogenase (NAD)